MTVTSGMGGVSLVVDFGHVSVVVGFVIDDLKTAVRKSHMVGSDSYVAVTLGFMAEIIAVVILDVVSEGERHRVLTRNKFQLNYKRPIKKKKSSRTTLRMPVVRIQDRQRRRRRRRRAERKRGKSAIANNQLKTNSFGAIFKSK